MEKLELGALVFWERKRFRFGPTNNWHFVVTNPSKPGKLLKAFGARVRQSHHQVLLALI
jgi:hypothetical protein